MEYSQINKILTYKISIICHIYHIYHIYQSMSNQNTISVNLSINLTEFEFDEFLTKFEEEQKMHMMIMMAIIASYEVLHKQYFAHIISKFDEKVDS